MVADGVDLRADRRPMAHHPLPLRAAILLHLQATGPLHLQVKVPLPAQMLPGPVAPVAQVDSVAPVVVADWEALASAALAWFAVALVAEVGSVDLEGEVPDWEVPALVALAWARAVLVALAAEVGSVDLGVKDPA